MALELTKIAAALEELRAKGIFKVSWTFSQAIVDADAAFWGSVVLTPMCDSNGRR